MLATQQSHLWLVSDRVCVLLGMLQKRTCKKSILIIHSQIRTKYQAMIPLCIQTFDRCSVVYVRQTDRQTVWTELKKNKHFCRLVLCGYIHLLQYVCVCLVCRVIEWLQHHREEQAQRRPNKTHTTRRRRWQGKNASRQFVVVFAFFSRSSSS